MRWYSALCRFAVYSTRADASAIYQDIFCTRTFETDRINSVLFIGERVIMANCDKRSTADISSLDKGKCLDEPNSECKNGYMCCYVQVHGHEMYLDSLKSAMWLRQ